jgi:hypothetical protein
MDLDAIDVDEELERMYVAHHRFHEALTAAALSRRLAVQQYRRGDEQWSWFGMLCAEMSMDEASEVAFEARLHERIVWAARTLARKEN